MKLFSLISTASAGIHYTDEYTTSTSATYTGTRTTTPGPFTGTCGGTITKSETIASPGFYDKSVYYNNLNCVWNIELGDDVIGFNIKRNAFDVEEELTCYYDFVEITANGIETAYCGYDEWRKRRHSDDFGDFDARRGKQKIKESGKSDAQHDNVINDGFPRLLFIEGGSALIRFYTDSSVVKGGFEFEIVKASRLQIISHHAQRIFDAVSDNKWAARYEGRLSKVLQQLEDSDNRSSCYDKNVPQNSEDEGDEVTVFDENDFCRLNGQVNAAINSYARHHACEGRGKVYRQIIRSARKVKNFFNQKYDC